MKTKGLELIPGKSYQFRNCYYYKVNCEQFLKDYRAHLKAREILIESSIIVAEDSSITSNPDKVKEIWKLLSEFDKKYNQLCFTRKETVLFVERMKLDCTDDFLLKCMNSKNQEICVFFSQRCVDKKFVEIVKIK